MATLFGSTGGTFWDENTKWKSGDSVCIWKGIGCDEQGYVTSIALPRNELRGQLPPELGLLAPRRVRGSNSSTTDTFTQGLTSLNLAENRIEGTIPEQVALLTSMREFNLHDNAFSGELPAGMANWTKLEFASFANNPKLSGEIPYELCRHAKYNPTFRHVSVDCWRVGCSCCAPSCIAAGLGPSEDPPVVDDWVTNATATPASSTSAEEDDDGNNDESDDYEDPTTPASSVLAVTGDGTANVAAEGQAEMDGEGDTLDASGEGE